MSYVNCGHCPGTPNRLLRIHNLPMPYCSACGKIVCHVCRALLGGGCRNSNFKPATVQMSGMQASRAAPVNMASVTVDVGGTKTTHSYRCPPGTYPPNVGDVHAIWTATVGASIGYVTGTNGSGGGKLNANDSGVFALKKGTSGLGKYGGHDHFHVGVRGYLLGSTERVWYCIDNSTNPVTIKFSAILNN